MSINSESNYISRQELTKLVNPNIGSKQIKKLGQKDRETFRTILTYLSKSPASFLELNKEDYGFLKSRLTRPEKQNLIEKFTSWYARRNLKMTDENYISSKEIEQLLKNYERSKEKKQKT